LSALVKIYKKTLQFAAEGKVKVKASIEIRHLEEINDVFEEME
jgi:D-arabinose 1-dehydrogenase-like Zn-dependent alcohol dehydrogenase